jgi:hypothetical protein
MSCITKIRTADDARTAYRNARNVCVSRGWTKAGFNTRVRIISEGIMEEDRRAGLEVREERIYAHVAIRAEGGYLDHMKA